MDGFSIITATHNSTQYAQMKQGYINALAGESDYEFLPIIGASSMVEAYNEGIKKAKYSRFIFTHQDAFPLRPGFGTKLRSHLRKFDIIGGAGTRRLEGPQWFSPSAPHIFGQVIHALPPTLNLGVALQFQPPDVLVVQQLEEGSIAKKSGLLPGDVLNKLHGTKVGDPKKFQELVIKLKQENANSAKVEFKRGGTDSTTFFDLSGGIPCIPLFNICCFNNSNKIVGGMQAIDGFFMAANRDIFDRGIANFTPEDSEGFHFYDLSFSFSAYMKGARIAVANDLFLGHACQSQGYGDPKWALAKDKWLAKFGSLLSAPCIFPRQTMLTTVVSPDLNYILHLSEELLNVSQEDN